MTSRAGRHLAVFGFAALIGPALPLAPAAAQSYLDDGGSSSSVTVDYSVLGQGGAGPMPMGGGKPNAAMPSGGCSCPGAPMGVIAAAPRPTFNNPFATNLAMQAPAVPPGFMTYAQANGASSYGSSSGGKVVLRAPAAAEPQMSEMPSSAPVPETTQAPLPATTPTANVASTAPAPTAPAPATEPTETQSAELPKTTRTQSEPTAPAATETTPTTSTATEPSNPPVPGTETPPSPPENVPATVPSPVTQGTTTEPAAPTTPAETPAAEAAPSTEPAPTEPAPAENPPTTNEAETTTPVEPSTEQQAAVTPPAPAEGSAAPAPEGGSAATEPNATGALPASATRILYTGDSDDVPADSNPELDKVAQAMTADPNMRVQILAYAAGTEDTESKARRKSLARGLAVRSYLIKAGVPSTRIDVRALGTKIEGGGPADRVDVIPAS